MDEFTPGPSRTKGYLLLGVVFVLGLICGAALFYTGQRSVTPRGPEGHPPGRPLDRMSRELNLDPDQRRAIREILDGQRIRFDEVLEDSREAIREVLSPSQQQQFDALRPPGPGLPGGPPGHRPPPPGHPPPGHPPPRHRPPPPGSSP